MSRALALTIAHLTGMRRRWLLGRMAGADLLSAVLVQRRRVDGGSDCSFCMGLALVKRWPGGYSQKHKAIEWTRGRASMHNCTQPLIWRWTSGLGFVHRQAFCIRYGPSAWRGKSFPCLGRSAHDRARTLCLLVKSSHSLWPKETRNGKSAGRSVVAFRAWSCGARYVPSMNRSMLYRRTHSYT
jgi:hypothetical protein